MHQIVINKYLKGDKKNSNLTSITIHPGRTKKFLARVAAGIISANSIGQLLLYTTDIQNIWLLRLIRFFYVDVEKNIPSIFSVILLSSIVLLLLIIRIIKRRDKDKFSNAWFFLSIGFSIMTIDEAWSFHERLIDPVQTLFYNSLPGIFKFARIISAGLMLIILLLFFWRFLFDLKIQTRKSFLLAGVIYLGGAIGMEMVGGSISTLYGQYNIFYSLSSTLEESLEMTGCILFISTLLKYMAKEGETIVVKFA